MLGFVSEPLFPPNTVWTKPNTNVLSAPSLSIFSKHLHEIITGIKLYLFIFTYCWIIQFSLIYVIKLASPNGMDGHTGNKPGELWKVHLRQKQSTIGKQSPGRVHSAECGQQGFQRAPGEPEQSSAESPYSVCASFASGTKRIFLLLESPSEPPQGLVGPGVHLFPFAL